MNSRIALNGRFSRAHHPSGTQVAAFHLFDAILRQPREMEMVVFADPAFPGISAWRDLPGVEFVAVPFQTWSRSRSQLWEQLVFTHAAHAAGCGAGHHPMNTSPANPGRVKSIVTLHDLNFLLHPEWHRRMFCLAYRWLALPGLQRASRVVVISEYVQDLVHKHLAIPRDKLSFIPDGLRELPDVEPIRGTAPYIFAVGAYQRHKNLARLIQAHQQLRKEFCNLELKIAGLPDIRFAQNRDLDRLLESPGVQRLGYLSHENLSAHYQGAALFCFPSLEEGFGLPLIEAMSAGAVVVTSKVSCLPEVAGDAAIYVDPTSVDDMAAGLRKALCLEARDKDILVQKGRDRARLFPWGVSALQYLKLYREVLSE